MLDQRRWQKLTLVSGPAGSGKSTLLSDWLDRIDVSWAWVSLDEADKDPRRFMTYLVSAIRRVAPHIGEGIDALLSSEGSLDLIVALEMFILVPLSEKPVEMVLVLDDLHLINDENIHNALRFFIENLPECIHLVIATRAEPSLSLSKLRANSEINEIRSSDLRFSLDEVRLFFSQTMGLNLLENQLVDIEKRTEGWVVALQLAALRLQSGVDSDSFIKSLSNQVSFVTDYLVEEVLKRQPAAVSEFILTTSILKRMCDPLCQALYGSEPLKISLKDLEKENLFIISLDEEHIWYRYHHLFADLLRAKLAEKSKERVYELHRRASQWFAEHELIHDSIEHAIASGDQELLADLVESSCVQVYLDGDHTTLQYWFNALDDKVIGQRLILAWCSAWHAVHTNNTPLIAPYIERFEKCAEISQEKALTNTNYNLKHLYFEPDNLRASAAFRSGKIDVALRLVDGILDTLPPLTEEDDIFYRIRVSLLKIVAGFCHYSNGNYSLAVEFQKSIQDILAKERVNSVWTLSVIFQVGATMAKGQLEECCRICRNTLQILNQAGIGVFGTAGYIHYFLGMVYLLRTDWKNAQDELKSSIQKASLSSDYNCLQYACYYRAYVMLELGDLDGAHLDIDKSIAIAKKSENASTVALFQSCQTLIYLAQGRLDYVNRWVSQQPPFEFSTSYLEEEVNLVRAWIAIETGQNSTAQEIVDAYIDYYYKHGRPEPLDISPYLTAWQALRAILLAADGNSERSCRALEQAVQYAMLEGVRSYFQLYADRLRPLINGMSNSEARAFLIPIVEDAAARRPHLHEQSEFIDTTFNHNLLSIREQEVLNLIALGLSNRHIARELQISEGTVKAHSRHIFSKLDAKNRVNAINKARILGLIKST